MKYSFLFLLTSLFLGCGSSREQKPSENALQKIRFDLSLPDENGLYGPESGKTALDYEFCIPRDEACRREVEGIDTTLRIQTAAGRIGCGPGQYLCIGNTHQPNWRQVIYRLAELPYVEKIEQVFWE